MKNSRILLRKNVSLEEPQKPVKAAAKTRVSKKRLCVLVPVTREGRARLKKATSRLAVRLKSHRVFLVEGQSVVVVGI